MERGQARVGALPIAAQTACERAAAPGEARPLRVLGVVPSSFFADYGCHVRVLEQARALQARGWQVHLATYPSGQDAEGLHIVRPPLLRRTRPQIGPSLARLPLDLALAWTAWREARRFRPDLILGYLHEGALIGSWIARNARVPLAFDLQGSFTGEMVDHGALHPGRPPWGLARRLEREIDRRPELVLASSRHSAERLVRASGCRSEWVQVVPDCVDAARFSPDILSDDDRQRELALLGVPRDCAVIVYLGLLGQHQGIPHLLQAAVEWPSDAPPAHFLVMGYPLVEEYRRLAGSLGVSDRVTFLGRVPYADAPRRLALGDVAVAPKVSDAEGHGKLVNYMATALPVVAFDTPLSREYLGELGRYATPRDSGALAHEIARMLQRPDRKALGLALRDRALQHYTCERLGAELDGALRRLCRAPGQVLQSMESWATHSTGD